MKNIFHRQVIYSRRLFSVLCGAGLFLLATGNWQPATAQTNLGPIVTTRQDDIGTLTPPANPPSGRCRRYYNLSSGLETWINSAGASCAPSGSGGSGINGNLTQNYLPKAVTTGSNPDVGDSTISESGTPLNVFIPRLEQTRYTDDFVWSQSPSGSLTGGVQAVVTLTPTPYGIDSSFVGANVEAVTLGPYFYVDIGGTGTAETAEVTATTCSSASAGTGSCTITFIPAGSHGAGFTVGAANAGAQEAINDCEVTSSTGKFCHIVLPCSINGANLQWDAPVITHANNVYLDGFGCARVQQNHRQQAVILGNHNIGNTGVTYGGVSGIGFSPNNQGTAPQVNLVSTITNSATGIGSASESSSTATYNTVGPSGSPAVCFFTTGQLLNISGVGYGGNYNNGGSGVTVLAPGCNGGTSFTATLGTTGNSPVSTFGSAAVAGQNCTWAVTFTGNHDFKYKDWIVIGGNLELNQAAGIRQVTDNPATGATIHFQTASCGAIQGTVYPGGTALEAYYVIEDNLNFGGRIENERWTAYLGSSANLWHYGLVVTADQSLTVDSMFMESGNAFRAPTTEWFGAAIFSPGPSGVYNANGAGILHMTNSYISVGTTACIDWQSANDIEVVNTILQDCQPFLARISNRRGAYGTAQFHGDHLEPALCTNPYGNLGCAGIVSAGMNLDWDGVTSAGEWPDFAKIGNGLTMWFYYIQAKNATSDTFCTTTQPNDQRCVTGPFYGNWGTSPLLPIGYAFVDSGTFGSPTISWPPVLNATSYNVYKVTVPATAVITMPYGTGNYGVATALNPATACTDNICTYTDTTGNSPNSVTIAPFVLAGAQSWMPYITFWPGTLFMGVSNDGGGANITGSLYCTQYRGTYPPIFSYVASPLSGGCWNFTSAPAIGNTTAQPVPGITPPVPASPTNSIPGVGQLWPAKYGISASDSGSVVATKGVFNFGTWPGMGLSYPFCIITWQDSNYYKTLATTNNRPAADAGDTQTCMDQSGGLATMAATWSLYINTIPNSGGTNWNVRYSSAGETIANESANAGQAACFTTGGLIGHCTSAVNFSGVCTCVNP